jgi:hypothetical protein
MTKKLMDAMSTCAQDVIPRRNGCSCRQASKRPIGPLHQNDTIQPKDEAQEVRASTTTGHYLTWEQYNALFKRLNLEIAFYPESDWYCTFKAALG